MRPFIQSKIFHYCEFVKSVKV